MNDYLITFVIILFISEEKITLLSRKSVNRAKINHDK